MTLRVGINGFGRIGRTYLRCVLGRDVEVVAINDIADPASLAHLLRYDSTYGRFDRAISVQDRAIAIDGRIVEVFSQRDPATLPWAELDVDVVVESTGRFRSRDDAAAHLKAGARKVLVSAPVKGADVTVVMGVNEGEYDAAAHDVISNASCTTNCVVPMVKVLNDAFGVRKGLMTTVHGYTNDQLLLDGPHNDLRRARSAAVNIIPTTTGAARSVGVVIPELAGRLDGQALRVPVEDGSLTDLTVLLDTAVTREQVNQAFAAAHANEPLSRVLDYTADPVVSRDVVGNPASCLFDAGLTQADGELVEVFGWYDNEWGYANRLADLTELVGARR